jgi:hypothetical protein
VLDPALREHGLGAGEIGRSVARIEADEDGSGLDGPPLGDRHLVHPAADLGLELDLAGGLGPAVDRKVAGDGLGGRGADGDLEGGRLPGRCRGCWGAAGLRIGRADLARCQPEPESRGQGRCPEE